MNSTDRLHSTLRLQRRFNAAAIALASAAVFSACDDKMPTDPGMTDAGPAAEPLPGDLSALRTDGGHPVGVTIRRSTGSSFSWNEDWLKGDFATHFADVDGDGYADAIKDTTSRNRAAWIRFTEDIRRIPVLVQPGLGQIDLRRHG